MKILVLASNPRKDLNLDDEIRILQGTLNQSANRDEFLIQPAVGVRVGDLQSLVIQHKPEVIHFCGHGSGEEGLIFKVDGGGEQRVRASALAGLFRLCPFVKCVLLNACYSEEQAEAIAKSTDYVIGMSHTIQDNAAIAFSKGFYTALGDGYPFEYSFEFGKNAIQLEVSESSIKRSGATSVETRKAEVVGAVKTTELKEDEKPQIFIRGEKQTASDLERRRSNQGISETKREEVLLKIDESLKNAAVEPKQEPERKLTSFSFKVATLTVKKGFIPGMSSIEPSFREGKAEYFEERLDKSTPLEMVKIPGGNFTMGSPNSEKERGDDEGPQHLVRIQPFFMGKYAVTQEQWFTVAQDFPKMNIDLNPDPSSFKGAKRPVEQVSWHEAVEFCERLSQKTGKTYRLPSEAEWEYACRAGTETPFHFGETITSQYANYAGNVVYGVGSKGTYREETTPVGSFKVANAFGLYDMHGNIWEWCADHWHENYTGAPRDGSAWVTGGDSDRRVRRGGSWIFYPRGCRSAVRGHLTPDYRIYHFGFRVVCVAP